MTRTLSAAARSLRKTPGFVIAAVVTLALGTGATTAIVSLISGVLVEPFPWSRSDRVGLVWAVNPLGERTWLSAPEFDDIDREIRAFAGAAAFTDVKFAHVGRSSSREVQALAVSHDFFGVLGVAPQLGRSFAQEDDRPNAARRVILGHAYWQTHFGSDTAIVGRSIRLDDRDYTVAGVLPAAFELLPASSVLPGTVDMWVALEPHLVARQRSVRFLHAIARLRDGATFESASAELGAYGQRVRNAFADAYNGGAWTFQSVSFAGSTLQPVRTPLFVVLALALVVLFMACANVANLLLARAERRRMDVAIRMALGTSPARLVGELLAEAAWLAGAGTVAGVLAGMLVPRVLRALDPSALPRLEHAGIDARVAAFMFALMLAIAGVFTLVPWFERLRLRGVPGQLLDRSGGRSPIAVRLGRLLVVTQTALAATVVIATVFLVDTYAKLQRVDLGLDPGPLVTARLTRTPVNPNVTSAVFFDRAVAAVQDIPGVEAVGAVSQLPLSGAMLGSTFLAGAAADARRIDVDLRGVAGSYFDAARIRVWQGRTFDARDAAAALPVAIVDTVFARALDPAGRVVGRRVRWLRQPDVDVEIIGVVSAVRHRGVAEPPRATVYRPIAQYPRTSMYVVARTAGDPRALTATVSSVLAAVDPQQPVADVRTMGERLAQATRRARTSLALVGALGVLGIVLAVVGVYGVLSVGVAHRRREFGVRLALGATPGRVQRLVLGEGLLLTIAGLAAGSIGAWLVARAGRALLYEASHTAVLPYLAGALLVLIPSAAAFALPAWRASRISPLTAMRHD
jgi:putative ABC transport system permease protein